MVLRIRHILTVYAFSALGVFLFTAPWSPAWEAATMTLAPTPVGELVRSGGFRGLVSGLGALNIWVAVEQGVLLLRSVRDRNGEGDQG